jgi:hypothetical protein
MRRHGRGSALFETQPTAMVVTDTTIRAGLLSTSLPRTMVAALSGVLRVDRTANHRRALGVKSGPARPAVAAPPYCVGFIEGDDVALR